MAHRAVRTNRLQNAEIAPKNESVEKHKQHLPMQPDAAKRKLEPRLEILFLMLAGVLAPNLSERAALGGPFDTRFNPPKLLGRDSLSLSPRVVLQPDGKILVHGDGFDTIGGVQTGPLARFRPAGSLDSSCSFSTEYSWAFSVAPLPNGQEIVNATLSGFSGDTETLLRVNSDGTRDNSFNAGIANDNIREITVRPDGKLLVGGLFTTF